MQAPMQAPMQAMPMQAPPMQGVPMQGVTDAAAADGNGDAHNETCDGANGHNDMSRANGVNALPG